MPQISSRNLLDSIVFILNECNKPIGLGVSMEDGKVILHKKFESNLISYGFKFAYFDELVFRAYSLGSYESVSLMQVSYFNYITIKRHLNWISQLAFAY